MDENTRQAMRMWALAQPVVSAFLSSTVRGFRDRDDLLQETAVAVLESFDSYDKERSFTAWALGIARNQVGTYLRRRRRTQLALDPGAIDKIAATLERVPAEQWHQLDHLHDCLQSLEGRARQMCVLRYEDDLKPSAIARMLDMSANAVSKSLQRIRDQLRDCIQRKLAMEEHPR